MTEKLIARIAQQLDQQNVPYMIIGGQAVLLYGKPRLTRDIDITLGVDSDQFHTIAAICNQLHLKILPEEPESFANQTKVLPAEDPVSKMRVDFIFSFTPYEQQAFKRANKVTMGGHPVCFATCEDVIIHKILAGRAVDTEDVKNMVLKNRKSLDTGYIKNWLSQFRELPEYSNSLEQFDAIMNSTL